MPAAVTCLFEVLFLYLFPVRGTGRGFRSRSRHKHGPLAVIGPGQFNHLTGDTLLTEISHVDKLTASGQLGFKKIK
jgi:hypothetical protein